MSDDKYIDLKQFKIDIMEVCQKHGKPVPQLFEGYIDDFTDELLRVCNV